MVLFLHHMMYKNAWLHTLGVTIIVDQKLVLLSTIIGIILLLKALFTVIDNKNIYSLNRVDSIVFIFIAYIFIFGMLAEIITFQSYYSLLQFGLIYLVIQVLGTPDLINKIIYTMIILFGVDLFTMLHELLNSQITYNSFQAVGMSFYAFPFLLGLALYNNKRRYYILATLSAIIIIISGLRRGWIFLIISILLFLYYQTVNRKVRIGSLIAIIGLITFYTLPNLENRTQDQINRTVAIFSGDMQTGLTNREVLWSVGLDVAQGNIWFGNGYSNTNHLVKQKIIAYDYGVASGAGRVHNLYIEIIGDVGIFGLCIFTVLVITVVLGLNRGIKSYSQSGSLRRNQLQIFTALFIGLLFVGIFGWGGIYNKEFWMFLGIISILLKIIKKESSMDLYKKKLNRYIGH